MSQDHTPDPKLLCKDCNGKGVDSAQTAQARKSGLCDSKSYIRCWTCNGNGIDPAETFSWTRQTPVLPVEQPCSALVDQTVFPDGKMAKESQM